MQNKVNFTFQNCKKEDFEHEASFDLEGFEAKLLRIFELNQPVERVDIVLNKTGAGYEARANVISDELPIRVEVHSHDNPALLMRDLCDKVLDQVREAKNKLAK